MSGGETEGEHPVHQAEKDTAAAASSSSSSSEAKKETTLAGYEDVFEGLAEEESEGEEDEEALKSKRGDEAGPRTVRDKSRKGQE